MPPPSDRPWYQPAPAAALPPAFIVDNELQRPGARRLLPRVRRFFMVGAGGIVVNNIVLLMLHGLIGVALLPATVVAVEVAIVHNYVLHEMWTFKRMCLSGRRFARFSLVTLIAFVLNVGIVQVLARLGLFYLLANLVGIGAGFAVNLAVSSMWIWRERTDGAHPAGHGQPGRTAVDGTGRTLPLPHDLHVGPAGGGHAREGAGVLGGAGSLLYRHRAGPARGRRNPGHRRTRCTR
jgi:putative flippase GtrA